MLALVGLAALLVLTAAAYAPSLSGPFVLDDWGTVENNMLLRRPDALRFPGLGDMLGAGRPLAELTWILDWRAAGLDPVRYRTVSLAFHLLAVAAAFAWLVRLLGRAGHPRPRGLALAVAALFALHPIQMDAAAYVSQRSEVMASLLYLLTLLLLGEAAVGLLRPRGLLAWLGGTISWVLAMGSKAIAITAPATFLVQQAVVAPAAERGFATAGRRVLRALAVAAPVALLAAWAAWSQLHTLEAHPEGGAGFAATPLTAWQYLLTQTRVIWLYLRLLAWPAGFAFDRVFAASTGVDGAVAVAGAGLLALLALAVGLWLRAERADGPRPGARLAAFGILFWFLVLAPTSSVVPVMDLAVEHRVYLAALGPFLAIAVAVDGALHRWLASPAAGRVAGALGLVVAVVLVALLWARAEVWGSVVEFYAVAAEASPGSARIQSNLGHALYRRGDLRGAEAAYLRASALARSGNDIVPLAGQYSALLIDQGRLAEGLAVIDRGLALHPGHAGLRANRAAALGRMGRIPEAIAEARAASAADPGDPRLHNLLGIALSASGDCASAIPEFQAAEALDPKVPDFKVTRAACLAALGRRDEACALLAAVAASTPVRPLPQDAAGRALALGCPIR